ncbi:MAG: macrolide ABC transporter ATP-binding protein [Archangium gephyra]|uniref:Macrolide ABC transporter ATP-binding protein n=1 Tax=Archangium gephyra TaxID=48 RepID=A0A2W5TC02_9BACT|nr:MAG: macrolide ABC transporter ATP-binding protein [Archangium gephyra]
MAVVEVENVSRVYEEKGQLPAQALRGVSLKVEKGEFMALSGPSGSGKTTLLNLIGGLDQVSSGEIRIDGRALSGLSRKDLADLRRDRIGYVFQAYNLVPVLTASENAAYVLELRGVSAAERRARVKAVFERIGLGAHLDSRPLKMSGGQQQRVAVARAIVAEPAVILADEPTANLDQATGAALMDLMRELNQERGITFIFSTHDPMVLERADRVVKLIDGQVVTHAPAP